MDGIKGCGGHGNGGWLFTPLFGGVVCWNKTEVLHLELQGNKPKGCALDTTQTSRVGCK